MPSLRRVGLALLTVVVAAAGACSAGGTPAPTPAESTPSSVETPAPAATPDPVLVGAGDIANAGDGDEATAALLDTIPGTIFTTGDNVYDYGTPAEFATYYGPSWGRHRDRTRPTPGNHDYYTAGAAGYFGYFGAAAGDPSAGYYSYELGEWHIVALNSNIAMEPGSAQEAWLRADLGSHPRRCTLAYWHHPLFTSGTSHEPSTVTRPLYQALYDLGADVVVWGHNHQYERFAPQDPDGALDPDRGLRAFVAGMGGASHYDFGTAGPHSEARNADTFGVLRFDLHPTGYDWQFVPVAGGTYADHGTAPCH